MVVMATEHPMRHLTFAALALSTLVSPALAQKVGETVDVGGWKISSANNPDGSTGCTATFVYDDKSIIGFSVDNDDTHMFIVSEPTAKMTKGQQSQLTFRVDAGKSLSGLGVAVDATTLAVLIPPNDIAVTYKALQAGNSLFITMGKQEFEEPLDGSNNAINALGACQSGLPARAKK